MRSLPTYLSLGFLAAVGAAFPACSAEHAPIATELDVGTTDTGGGFGSDGLVLDDTGTFALDGGDDTDPGDGRFSGGDAACAKSEAAAIKPPVDIIISIDQSGSMSDDIANVKANVNKLSDFLKKTGLDYRVVMVAQPGTGTYSVCVPPPLGAAACGAENKPIFKQINQNVQSWDSLKLVLATYDKAPGPWSDVLRTGAVKAFIPITDDNSNPCTTSTGCGISAVDFDKGLLAKPGGQFGTATKRNYVVYPIMGAPAYPAESPKCGTNAVNTGPEYIALAKLTKGKWFPICLKDFGPVFEEIAKTLASKVACELTVPPPPTGEKLDPDKVNVVWTPTGGKSEDVLQDKSKPCDAGANGWQYSPDGTKILLCGAACTKAQADLGSKLTVEFGCSTKVKPPA